MKKGCLIIHGLTGTPANMKSVSDALQARGYLVKAPLLQGHGTDLKTLTRSGWEDWYGTVVRAHHDLAKEVDSVYCVGLSLGALLGMKLAIDCGDSIKALVLLGTPFEAKPLFRFLVIPAVRYTPLRFFLTSVAKNFEKSVLDPQGREFYRQNSLSRMPCRSVFQTQDLVNLLRKDLKKITQPLLMIHAHKDHLADPHGLLEIRRGVSSKKVDIMMLENSGHVLTCDYNKEKAASRVVEFFDKIFDKIY